MTSDESIESVLARAEARARSANLPYRGAVTPSEAWQLVEARRATLVDVRTRAEWEYVGRVPDAPLIEWKRLGEPGPNPHFLDELAELGERDQIYLFLCRSGVRSHAAAVAAAAVGYTGACNILEGFEGDLDASGHRGTRGGWRHAGLPWIQS